MPNKHLWRRQRVIAAVSVAAFVVMLSLAWGSWASAFRALGSPCAAGSTCPTWEDVEAGRAIPEAFHLLDRDGRSIAAVAGPARMHVPLDSLPERLVQGYVAVEDRRFWRTLGVDGVAIYRAALGNLRSGEVVSGASTIPMQLVRTIYASELQEVGRWERKLHELWIAPRLVMRLGHERTLEMYLNSVYLGDGVYGVEAASRHYFGVPSDSLTLGQTATLIGLTRTPGRYHPRSEPDRSQTRRDLVLGVMAAQGVVRPGEAERAAAEPLAVAEGSGLRRSRSYVTAAVTRELRRVAPELAGVGGLRIRTTIDSAVQSAGEAAVERGLERVGSRRGPAPDPNARLQAAAVSIDPVTGAIRGLVGGRDFARSELDRATQARRPLGSLVKPILLAAALEDGAQLHHPISTAPISFAVEDGSWTPDDHVEDREVSLADMVAMSSNRAAVRLGRSLGMERFRTQAMGLGLDAPVPPYPSAFLGAFDATLLDVVSAYAPFANGGWTVEPYIIESIHSRSGALLYDHATATEDRRRAIRPETSFLVLQAMRGVVTGGTGWRVRDGFDGPAAGKTGTSDGGHDAWFVGFTPGLAAGVWLGFDLPAPITDGGSGGSLAAPVWGDWMGASGMPSPDTEVEGWRRPPGVTLARLHPPTGAILPPDCGATVGREFPQVWVTARAARAPTCRPSVRIEARTPLAIRRPPTAPSNELLRGEPLRLERRIGTTHVNDGDGGG